MKISSHFDKGHEAQAKERHISIDEMLRENAIYTIENTQ